MKTILAQDVTIGTKLSGITVARIETFTCGNGETGYRYYDERGRCFWNRHNDELVLAE